MDTLQSTDTLPWRTRPFAELLRLTWPIAISQLSFSLMTAVDTLFVGHLGAAALAGVAIGGVTTFTVACFGIGTLRATKIAVAQATGAGRHDATHAFLGASLCAGLGLGLITALVGQAVAQALPALTASVESGHAAATYAAIRLLGMPVLFASIALREAQHGLGHPRGPMLATLIANLANAALVSLFLFGLHMGIAGVASATLLAQVVELVALVSMQQERGFGLTVWTRSDLLCLLRLGIPLGIERFFDVASFSLMVALFARMGDRDLAAHQIASQAFLFVVTVNMAIGEANCVLIGQAVGGDCLHLGLRVQRVALLSSYVYAAACSAVFVAFSPLIARQFTDDARLIEHAASLLHIIAVLVWAIPFYQIGQSSLRAIGDVRAAALITVGAAWLFTPLFTAGLGIGLGMGAAGGWIGLGAEIACAAVTFWWRLRGRAASSLHWPRSAAASLALGERESVA